MASPISVPHGWQRVRGAAALALAGAMLVCVACSPAANMASGVFVNGKENAAASEPLPAPTEAVVHAATPVEVAATLNPFEHIDPMEDEHATGYELPDESALRQTMLDLINEARTAAGLQPVALDDLAERVAQEHAVEMVRHDYLSHWDLNGFGPDARYAAAGGTDKSQENVYSFHRTYCGRAMALEDWQHEVQYAFRYLMSSSFHRNNIMAPEHTHVGIGLAYNEESGELRVVQVFLNHYIELDGPPHAARPQETLTLTGRLLVQAEEVLINVDYERLPQPTAAGALSQAMPYRSRAWNVDVIYPEVEADNTFTVSVPMQESEGLYHVRFWLTVEGSQFLAADLIVWVTEE